MADKSQSFQIGNKQLLVNAMGYWPSFHDANVLSASREGDQCEVLIHVFKMTNQVDERGYFVLTKHHRVRLWMKGVSKCSLPTEYRGDTLDELRFEFSEGGVTVSFDSVTDQDWQIDCREAGISEVVPCDSKGVPI